ncbi:DUF4145 domain-containing protein [Actinoplanes sp. CA-252034]|uniref:DUF4145 domain-containing protein n=1 Tax=Actinoplanes sp. CA-252034 TaxID=3239906 RepID=UPI003D95E49B
MLEDLDDNTLDGIASIACGGGDYPVYRSTNDIRKLLTQAKWNDVPPHDGTTSRKDWLAKQLRSRRNTAGAIDAVVLRLVDPREYIARNEPLAAAEVSTLLNTLLTAEGFEISHHHGKPTIRPYKPTEDDGDDPTDTTLHVAMADIVSDRSLAAVLDQRLTEARICRRHGAYTSAVIMLGSLLEGILLDAVATRLPNDTTRLDNWTLDNLIKTARQHRWIQSDRHDFGHLLRQYRNLVHPRAEIRRGDAPDAHTLNMCWPVISATLNDLAATAP